MDKSILRSLIYFFLGLMVIFSLLILVNNIGSRAGSGSESASESDEELASSAEERARQALAATRATGGGRLSMIPSGRTGLSTAAVVSEGAIRLVKDGDFNGVAEPPKDMTELLSEMAGGKKGKPDPIKLDESDLDRKVRQLGGKDDQKLKAAAMPELGRGAGNEGVTLLSAPVDYKIFKSSGTWAAFASSREFTPAAHDFSADDLLILVSISDFPDGIFKVTGVERLEKETVVSYRVDPLAMSPETPAAQRGAYSVAPVPKGRPVRLRQVP